MTTKRDTSKHLTGEKGWSLDSHGPARVEVMGFQVEQVRLRATVGGKAEGCMCDGGWLSQVQVQALFTLALKDERFQLEEFSPRRVRIRLSDARLEDEGGYFCQLYTEDTHHQIATLTVLGTILPRPHEPHFHSFSASHLS